MDWPEHPFFFTAGSGDIVVARRPFRKHNLLLFAVVLVAVLGCTQDNEVGGETTFTPVSTPETQSVVPPTPTFSPNEVRSTPTEIRTLTPTPSISATPAPPSTIEASATTQPTPNATQSALPTAVSPSPTRLSTTATVVPTILPTIGSNPTPTPTLPPTSVQTFTPTATAVPSPQPSPTVLPTPIQTPSPTPSSPTATQVPVLPTPTADIPPTPVPTADPRFALIVGGRNNSEAAYFANAISVDWYLDYGEAPSVDSGLSKLRAIMLETGYHPYSDSDIINMVNASPGSYFQIGNEPNILGDANLPAGYADALNYYVTRIKAADPTAKIVGPNILNFDFTCVGCGGYTSGRTWLEQMRQSYKDKYGTEPPIDIWALHQYPLDWFNLPTVNDAILSQDLEAFRSYLDTIPGQSNAEIWITEFGLHWGFSGLQYQKDGTLEPCDPAMTERCWPGPVGEYQTEQVIGYLDRLTTYYKDNSSRLNLTKWFLWRHHSGFGPNPTGTNGLTLFDSFYAGASLSTVGSAYRDLIFGR